jgi:hypothetical protein
MLLELTAVSVVIGFLKPVVAAAYKAVRVAIVSSKAELAKQLGLLTIAKKTVRVGEADVERDFEVGNEALITVWRRASVFMHVLLTS